MKKIRFGVSLICAISCLLSIANFTQGQHQSHLIITADSVNTQNAHNDRSILALAYGKLAKFVRAGNIHNGRMNGEHEIKFDAWNIRTGPIEEIYDTPYGQLVSKPSGDILDITPGAAMFNDKPEKVFYAAQWGGSNYEGSSIENWDKTTVKEVFKLLGNSLPPVKKYTSYEMKVHFMGKERSYRAMIFYHSDPDPRGLEPPRVSFADNIVGTTPITKAFMETRSAVD